MTRFGDALSKAYARHEQAHHVPGSRSLTARLERVPAGSILPTASPSMPDEFEIQSTNVATSHSASKPEWTWPAITDRLLAEARDGFLRLADRLRHGSLERNISSVIFTGIERQIGRTTVLLSLARALQERRPDEALLLIDADFSRADLASRVGLSPVRGLWEVLQSDIAPESVLQSGPGRRLALLPLSGPVTPAELETIGPEGLLPLIAELREQFPLILVDAGPVNEVPWNNRHPLLWNCAGLDALVHVQREGEYPPDILQSERLLCRETGMEFLGVIDTFARNPAPSESSKGPPPVHFSRGFSTARTGPLHSNTTN